jgi:hypothetical protein
MRLDINLASHPYQEEQVFYRRWVPGLTALGIVTLLLVGYAIYTWIGASETSRAIRERRNEMEQLEQQRKQAMTVLENPGNQEPRLRAQVLNELLARKAFSWTRVFGALEKIMPSRVHLMSIEPTINEENQLAINMQVEGNSRDQAIELLRRMEGSDEFANPRISSESVGERGEVQLAITALYQAPKAEAGMEEKPDEKKDDAKPEQQASAAAPTEEAKR